MSKVPKYQKELNINGDNIADFEYYEFEVLTKDPFEDSKKDITAYCTIKAKSETAAKERLKVVYEELNLPLIKIKSVKVNK